MAGSVNKVILVGRLGKDPEIRTMQSGDKVAGFSIATSETWKDKATGERKERTEWHNISIFNQNLVKVAENYLKKGANVYIEGQLETRKWTDKDGRDRYNTDVVLRPFSGEIIMLDSKSSGGGGGGAPFNDGSAGGYSSGGSSSSSSSSSAPMDDMEDEIPF